MSNGKLLIRFHTIEGALQTIDVSKQRKKTFSFGRGSTADVIIEDSQLSRIHCKFGIQGDNLTIEDNKSSNGTWLNGKKIDNKKLLKKNDSIIIGSITIRIEERVFSKKDKLIGRELIGIEIQKRIGKGGFGTVYKGIQLNLGREIAVKVLDDKLAQDDDNKQAFLTEARRAGRLNHANLIQVHDVQVVEDLHLLVMELAEHGSAVSICQKNGTIIETEALKMISDISKALVYAHEQGIVHRDVKPGNILVASDKVFKLGDLGIASPMSSDGYSKQKKALGSPLYIAPEQARGGSITGAADFYALGASIWHMAVGEPMYEGNKRELVAQHLNADIPDLKALLPEFDKETIAIILALIVKDPKQRMQDGLVIAKRAEKLYNRIIGMTTSFEPLSGPATNKPRGMKKVTRKVAGSAKKKTSVRRRKVKGGSKVRRKKRR